MLKKIPPPPKWPNVFPPVFAALLKPILTRQTQIEGGFGLYARCCVHFRCLKVVRMNIITFFGHLKLGPPYPPETHI